MLEVESTSVNKKKRKRESGEGLEESDPSTTLPYTRVATEDNHYISVQQYFTYLPNSEPDLCSESPIDDAVEGSQEERERRQKGAESIKQMVTTANWKINYEDIRFSVELGCGFFGKVYKAFWQDKTVAVKVITRCEFRNDTDVELFQREIAVLGNLRHPNIVEFLGVGISEDGGKRCMITEFMAGGSLRTHLDESFSTVTESMRRKIARDVASAMHYLHTHNPKVIHRDLSSMNILLSGDRLTAKVADFGMSRLIDQSASDNTMTMAVGALAWMAPEVFSGQHYSEKVDVYSYGICLAELLTGGDPYQAKEPIVYASLATKEGLRPPLPESINEQWKELVESCWLHEPNMRPSFHNVIEYLNLLLPSSTSPVPSPQSSPPPSPSPPSSPVPSVPSSLAPPDPSPMSESASQIEDTTTTTASDSPTKNS